MSGLHSKWDSQNLIFYNRKAYGGFYIGEFASTDQGAGLALSSVRTAAFRVYADDGGTALTAGAYRAAVARMLWGTKVSSGDISVYGLQGQLKITGDQAAATGIAGGTWGYLELASGGKVNIGGGVVSQVDVPSGATINTVAACYLAKANTLAGTHTGNAVILYVPTPGAGTFDQFLQLGASTGLTTGTTGSTAAGCLKVMDGVTQKYIQLFSAVS